MNSNLTAASGSRRSLPATPDVPGLGRGYPEARECDGLGLEHVEHGQQRGDSEQLANGWRQILQFERPTLTCGRGIRLQDVSQSCAVDVRHTIQVQQET